MKAYSLALKHNFLWYQQDYLLNLHKKGQLSGIEKYTLLYIIMLGISSAEVWVGPRFKFDNYMANSKCTLMRPDPMATKQVLIISLPLPCLIVSLRC